MSAEEDHVPSSNEVSSQETEVDPQFSACAQDGPPPDSVHRPAVSNSVRLAVGQLLSGRYRIERELAEGGMGVVYLAADEQVPGERFAVKVLKEELHRGNLTQLREEVRKTVPCETARANAPAGSSAEVPLTLDLSKLGSPLVKTNLGTYRARRSASWAELGLRSDRLPH